MIWLTGIGNGGRKLVENGHFPDDLRANGKLSGLLDW